MTTLSNILIGFLSGISVGAALGGFVQLLPFAGHGEIVVALAADLQEVVPQVGALVRHVRLVALIAPLLYRRMNLRLSCL